VPTASRGAVRQFAESESLDTAVPAKPGRGDFEGLAVLAMLEGDDLSDRPRIVLGPSNSR
jgi:hypothetical protein